VQAPGQQCGDQGYRQARADLRLTTGLSLPGTTGCRYPLAEARGPRMVYRPRPALGQRRGGACDDRERTGPGSGAPNSAGRGGARSLRTSSCGCRRPGLRPSGASIVPMDNYPKYEIAEGVVFCPVCGRNLSSTSSPSLPQRLPHSRAPEEQISNRARGRDGDHGRGRHPGRRPGDVIIFPSEVPHSGRTIDPGACGSSISSRHRVRAYAR